MKLIKIQRAKGFDGGRGAVEVVDRHGIAKLRQMLRPECDLPGFFGVHPVEGLCPRNAHNSEPEEVHVAVTAGLLFMITCMRQRYM
jgi:hypothetical protein